MRTAAVVELLMPARLQLDFACNLLANYNVQIKTELSQKEDADAAAAARAITQGNTQLQAALQMQAKMPRTTLFDFMG